MRKKYFKLLKILLVLVSFYAVSRFCHQQTRGFQITKIQSKHHADPHAQLPLPSGEEQEQLNAIFSQPFYFLGSGGQCYAFVSEDQKTVLKFFKKHHIRFWKFLNRVTLPSALEGYRQKILHKTLHQSPAFFESCKISYLDLKERTGLIYLHLNKTDFFQKQLTIVDKLNIAHQIDLDSIDFALQRKAEFTKPKLKKLIRKKLIDEAKQCIDSMVGLIVERCQKGIQDRDPNFRRNVGFVGLNAIEIDIGSYSRDDTLSLEEELVDKTAKLHKWLERKSPELVLYLDEVLKDKLANNAALFTPARHESSSLSQNELPSLPKGL